METLATQIYNGSYELTRPNSIEKRFECMPFFIVCASSGTGKTQLPFCLNCPVLYFTVAVQSQSIYNVFQDISTHLKQLLNEDFTGFCQQLGINVNQSDPNNAVSFSLNNFSLERIRTALYKYKTLGFIVELIRIFNRMKRGKYAKLKWPRLEVLLEESVKYDAIDHACARAQLHSMLKDGELEQFPLVFLDEFNVSQISMAQERARYAFYRNIFRGAGLIAVLMGTNSHIANMLTASETSGSQTAVWCFVFYKLPRFPKNYLIELVSSCFASSSLTSDSSIFDNPISDSSVFDNSSITSSVSSASVFHSNELFAQLLIHLLLLERPLFAIAVLKYLESEKFKNGPINLAGKVFCKFFDEILVRVFESYLERKEWHLNFFYRRQISFFENSYRILLDDLAAQQHPGFIHSHLASLKLPTDVHPDSRGETFFEVYLGATKTKYWRQLSESRRELLPYEAAADLPTFSSEPLTCMALSLSTSQSCCAFRMDTKCCTAYQALLNSHKNDKNDPMTATTKYSGTDLEVIVNMAFMVSSHAHGICGASFVQWFPYFVQQLGAYPNDSWAPPQAIEFIGAYRLEGIHVPYMSFNGSMWDHELKRYLAEVQKIPLGSFVGARFESRDMNAQSFNSAARAQSSDADPHEECAMFCELSPGKRLRSRENNVIVSECKMRSESLTKGDVKKIVDDMRRTSCEGKINIIVAISFSENLSFLYRIASVYQLKRAPRDAQLNPKQKAFYLEPVRECGENTEELFVLIALKELHDETSLRNDFYYFRE